VAFEEIERSVSVPHQDFRLRYFGEKRPEQQVRNPNYNPLIDDPSEEFLSSSSLAGSSNQSNTQEVR